MKIELKWTQAYLMQIASCGKRDFFLNPEANYIRLPTGSTT
ncbi:MAG TPA: hypothetical protein PK294_10520 [Ignavibacteria bacterium]|nr:hypothetical protein [Ignavibacteria bacterium]